MEPERFTRLVLVAPAGLWNAEYPVMDFFVASPAELAAAVWADPTSPMAQATVDEWARSEELLGPGADHTAMVRYVEHLAGSTIADGEVRTG